MVITREIEGKTEDAPQLARGDNKPAYEHPGDSRKAGGQR